MNLMRTRSRVWRRIAVLFVIASGLTTARAAEALTLPPSVLTALPAIGAVYWRAQCGPLERWALGVRAFRVSATDEVNYVAGGRHLERVLQPFGTVWFPFTSAKLQTIRVRQHTEPGLLRATVIVNFGVPPVGHVVVAHCYAYAPPRVTVQVYPR